VIIHSLEESSGNQVDRDDLEHPLNEPYQNDHETRITGLDDVDDAFLTEYEIVAKLSLDG
jgi:hypothetical protein